MKSFRWIAVLVTALMLLGLIPVSAGAAVSTWDGVSVAAGFSAGDGTEANPYLIGTAAELAKLAKDVNEGTPYTGAYFQLTSDIDLADKNWMPIGNAAKIAFRGHFDGMNHEVTGLTCVQTDINYAGLFGLVIDGTVQNLYVSAEEVCCPKYSGVVIASCNVTPGEGYRTVVYNCHAEKADKIIGSQIGGVIGRNSTTGAGQQMFIIGCSAKNCNFVSPAEDDTVWTSSNFASLYYGGIIGTAGSTVISGCAVENCKFDVGCGLSNTYATAGGIVGAHGASSAPADIDNCYVYNCEFTLRETVTAPVGKANIGGLIGRGAHVANSSVKNCYAAKLTLTNKCETGLTGTAVSYVKDWVEFGSVYVTDDGDAIGDDALLMDYPVIKIENAGLNTAEFTELLNKGNTKAVWELNAVEGHPVINVDAVKDNVCETPSFDPSAETVPAETVPAETEPETRAPETEAPETEAPETKAPETRAPETQAPETNAPETQKAEEKSGCGSSAAVLAVIVTVLGSAWIVRKK